MSVTYHERPGVYSDYDASSVTATGLGAKIVAVAGISSAKSAVYEATGFTALSQTVGADTELGRLARLLFANGAGTVLAVPVAGDTQAEYANAFDLIFAEKRADYIVCASGLAAVHADLKARVEAASELRNECIGFVGTSADCGASELIAAAQAINSERMVLVGPGFTAAGETGECGGWYGAAALAGVLAAQTDPALPLNGAQLRGLTGTLIDFDETTLDSLIVGGVTVCETVSGTVSVIRGVTTRSKTGGASDATWRELTTVLIIDEVIPAIRTALRAKFARAKNNAATRGAIRSQVIVELEDRVAREIIDAYEDVSVTASASDPTTCIVEFGFAVVHGLNRIYLTAHISV